MHHITGNPLATMCTNSCGYRQKDGFTQVKELRRLFEFHVDYKKCKKEDTPLCKIPHNSNLNQSVFFSNPSLHRIPLYN